MPIYLLNVYNIEAREVLIELEDLSPLLQEGLLIEAKNKKEAREHATEHYNTMKIAKNSMASKEIQIRINYRNLWQDPKMSSIQKISSS